MGEYIFMQKTLQMNARELKKLRLKYIAKRKAGDHRYKTLTKIKMLTDLLLSISYQGE